MMLARTRALAAMRLTLGFPKVGGALRAANAVGLSSTALPLTVLAALVCLSGRAATADPGAGRPYHVPARVNVLHPSPHRQTVCLDGEWAFETDPDDVGVVGRWFEPAVRPELARRLHVPGCWDIQGVGRPTAKAQHNYVGPAWYRRTVGIPADWAGRRCWLKIGGAHRYADVWVNATYVGHHDTYVTAFQFDVTDLVRPGTDAVIAIRVDNRPAYPNDMTGCFSWFVNWGGLFRSVELEATADSYLAAVVLQPEAAPRGVRVIVEAPGERAAAVAVSVGEQRATAPVAAGVAEVVLPLPGSGLWSPEAPVLHLATVELLAADDTVLDSWLERFGLRSFAVRNGDLLLNGQPLFLRGYGDDCVQPLTIHTPVDRDVHRRHLQKTKEYGFLYVRHHSWTPPPEYFDAADELGFLIQPELPVGYEPWLLPNAEKLERQLREIVRQYANHPSLAIYCMGNELRVTGPVGQLLDRLVALAQRLDPTRFVRHTDPGPIRGPGEGTCEGVQHEYGNVCVFPDVRVQAKFGAGYKPVRSRRAAEIARRTGMEHLLPVFAANSARLQSVLTRIYLENARARAPEVDGYNYWLITDCADEANTGLFDDFWDDRGVWTPQAFRRINGPTVLLLRADRPVWHGSSNWSHTEALDLRLLMGRAWPATFRAGVPADIEVLLSDYSGTPFRNARLDWAVAGAKGEVLVAGQLDAPAVTECFRTVSLGPLQLDLPPLAAATAATLHLRLHDAEREASAQYPVWLFPAGGFLAASPRPVWLRGGGPLAAALRQRYPFLADGTEAEAPVRVTVGDPDADDIEFAARGGTLLALGRYAFRSEQAVFGTAWWQGGNNRGTVVRQHSSLAGFPHDGYADLQLQRLIDGGRVMILTGAPVEIDPIIRGIDPATLGRSQAYLFEAPVGDRGGRLLVTTLNVADTVDTPEGAWLLDRLLRDVVEARTTDAAVGLRILDWLRPALEQVRVTQSIRGDAGAGGGSSGTVVPGRPGAVVLDLRYDGALPVTVEVTHSIPEALTTGLGLRRSVRLLPGVSTGIVWPVVAAAPGERSVGPATVRLGDAVRELAPVTVRAAFPCQPQNSSFELVGGIAPSPSTRVVAAYEFAEGEGRTLHDSVGANHGRIQGAARWGLGPAPGRRALELDGQSACVVVPDASALDLDSGFAVEVVFRSEPEVASGPGCLVDKGGSARRNYGLYLLPGGELSAATYRAGTEFMETTRDLGLIPGVWHNALWTSDATSGWLYVNGRLRGSWTVGSGSPLGPNEIPLFLGKRGPGNDMFLRGALARLVVARVEGVPTLAPRGWLPTVDSRGTACVDRATKLEGAAALRLEPAGGRCAVRTEFPIRVRPGFTYAVGAALAVAPDYDRRAGLPAVVWRAGATEKRLRLPDTAEAGRFVELTQALAIPQGTEELVLEVEAFGGGGAAWADAVRLSPEPGWEERVARRTPPGTVTPGVQWREAEEPDGTNGEPPPVTERIADAGASGGAAVRLLPPDSQWAGLWWRFETRPHTAYAVWVRYRGEGTVAGFDDLFVCGSAAQPLPRTERYKMTFEPGPGGYRWFRVGFASGAAGEVRIYLENEWGQVAETPSALWDAIVLEELD